MPKLRKDQLQQVFRFVFSAGLGFAVNIGLFHLLINYVFKQGSYQLPVLVVKNRTLALFISFFLGVLVNFLMTRYIVFTASQTTFKKQMFRFMSVAIIGFYANKILLEVMIHYLNLHPTIALVVTGLCLFTASFFVHKFFSFSLSIKQKHVAATTPASN